MSWVAWQVVFCILIADFITGLVHWFEDTYGLPTWPLVGEYIVKPNIDHHANPTLMVRMGDFFGRNLQAGIVALVVLAVCWFVGWVSWQLSIVLIVSTFGNEIHAWSHGAGKKNPFVRYLHESAIVVTPQHHSLHHRGAHDKAFCTVTNLLNPILDRIRFWKGIERLLRLVGMKPVAMTAERNFL